MEYNYPKKSIWKWILIYVLISAVAYGLIYYFFFYKKGEYNYDSQQNQDESSNQTQDSDVKDWKEYSNSEGGFSLKYPSSWVIDDKTSEGSIEYGPPKNVIFTGGQGILQVSYGTGFGGMCEQGYEKLLIGNKNFDVCHEVIEDVERWSATAEHLGKYGVGLFITVNKPYLYNRDIIISILSTFKFID